MKYALLIYGDGNTTDPVTDEEMAAHIAATVAYHKELERKGHLLVTHPLEPASEAVTVRTRDGKLSMTDGPFMETKEYIGGFILIEARDLNEAIRIAGDHPAARWDAIEVRAAWDLPT